MKSLNELTFTEARRLLKSGDVSSVDVTKACLKQIASLNGALNVFLEVYEDEALEAADRSDARRLDGKTLGPLDGLPIALKDNILYQGRRCTSGSKILESYIAPCDATVTRKLKEGGAVILGKTNMDEFAMGSSTEYSAYGATKHPRDPERVPGGSSGGSAAAVASSMCLAALGSDTGGSIRQPAAFCGVVGLKPTYGRVSRSGLVAMASSLDQIGPLTKNVEDAATLLELLQGVDSADQTTAIEEDFTAIEREDLKGVKIGLPRQAWGNGISDGVREDTEQAIKDLESLGATITEIDLPFAEESLAVYYVLMPCEVSANLSRFDGMRYGLRMQNLPLFETYAASRAHGLGTEVKRRILLGTFALSRGYYDAYYVQAKKVQTLIKRAYESAFQEIDIIVTPTAPTTAFKIGEKTNDPLEMYLEDIFTVGANVAGLPAVSLPCGNHEGLPVGLQFIGNWFREDKLLSVAGAYEKFVAMRPRI
ncbi:Asp-tRNA(Asn)/Glu-tRNA(Gln) amidotransferase subunit GatA [Patescibacteria group bacterium]|nr:Asp-tRNA(Asn)/Glu-tRNA(Gln) amidotransferase subunit GatA [Patescibacteria group bacterium]MBU1034986.1 Asp-tRNA(Asn)/Glu-tRNA(Gln) amidotransferase subunit GatA [Patescibacteria group bacterium]MBU1630019.1 Asp-tRNA(Asn)/Glu-tRNA(Gln) amidotransferase subunit GatA [Patescibacteria group bacterium]MBU1908039.1 Asp-tRNA(Asn)/Glu-tRNA(Gln) amidotransferase subunit GatA [Patescibacteria group bacterium]